MDSDAFRFGDLVLFKDHQVIACNKPPGMPVQEDRSGDTSLHRVAQAYSKHDLYVVHRIDRPCSGVVLFARNKATAASLSQQFAESAIDKVYFAVVRNGLVPARGELVHYLRQGNANRTVASSDPGSGKKSVLHYEIVGSIDNYSLLRVRPVTGRSHQIRAQLAAAGFPIKGDVKYGFRRGNRDRSIHLHAWKVSFKHPTKHVTTSVEAPVPDEPVWNAFDISRLSLDGTN